MFEGWGLGPGIKVEWDTGQKELGKRVRRQPGTTSQRCQDPGWAEKGRQSLEWR